jgi:hypothetical protein
MARKNAYQNYEEFEREELSRDRRLDVSYEELLGEFVDEGWRQRERQREGLFDDYDDDSAEE